MEKPLAVQLRQACAQHQQSVEEIVGRAAEMVAANPLPIYPGDSLDSAEAVLITATLELHAGDKGKAAAALGISLKTLYNRLREYAAAERRQPRATGHQQPAA